MDIEGAEPDALRGATRILSEDRPTLFVEAHHDDALSEIMSIVEPFGYNRTARVFNASPTYEIVLNENRV